MSDFTVAARLLPDVPGWNAGLASLTRGSAGNHLLHTYGKGRSSVFVEVTAGTSAAQVVAQAINAPLGEEMDGRIGSRLVVAGPQGLPRH